MTDDTPQGFACSLDARAFQERIACIANLNQKHLRKSHREGETLVLIYAAEACHEVESMVTRERDCCAFLAFDIQRQGEAIELTITVPEHARENADALLAPFQGTESPQEAGSCCGACVAPAKPVKAGRVAGAAAATSVTAVLACGACCVLPLAFPAVAASAAGGVMAWLAGAHYGITVFAVIVVAAAWLWLWRQSVKRKARPAPSTLVLMGLASMALVIAIAWPHIETPLMAAVSHG